MDDMNNSCFTNHLTRHGKQTEMEMLAKLSVLTTASKMNKPPEATVGENCLDSFFSLGCKPRQLWSKLDWA